MMNPAMSPDQENYPLTVEGTMPGSMTTEGYNQGGIQVVNSPQQPGVMPSSDDQAGVSNTINDTSDPGMNTHD